MPLLSRSPDLILVYFFVGYFKNQLYKANFENEGHLLRSVRSAFDRIISEILHGVIHSTEKPAYFYVCTCYSAPYLQFLTIIVAVLVLIILVFVSEILDYV